MRGGARILALGLCAAGLAGCQGLRAHAPARMRPADLATKGSNETAGQLASQPKTKTVGVLAGQVVDSANQRRPGASLQIAPLDGGAAFHASTDENGYFLIQGLEPGKQYKLSARTKAGEEAWGGTTLAQPPNVVVLIKLTEKLPEGAPAPKQKDVPASPSAQGGYVHEPAGPSSPSGSRSPARLGSPRNEETGSGNVPLRPEYLTRDDQLAQAPPMAQIRGPIMPGVAPSLGRDVPADPPPAGQPSGDLFAVPLKTLDGSPTTLGEQKKSLTLVQLWTTASSAGAEALPKLAELERKFGPKGLAVVAVAYEDGKPDDVAARLRFQADRLRLRFPLLLGGGDSCPLLRLLDVRRYPTLVLLDAQGRLLWRGDRLTAEDVAKLDDEIGRRLK